MSLDETTPLPPQIWEPLSPLERRILGVLVEKQKTSKTADTYPLSLNALTTGCNQKSNRDPVLNLGEDEVEEGLAVLQKKGLVVRLTSGRVDRFKHELYDKWTQHGAQMAVLAELLLRGPQTKGELRTRAARMDPIDSLEALDEVLRPLLERRLVLYLTDPDRRGAIISHGFYSPDDIVRLKAQFAGAALAEAAPSRSESPAVATDMENRLKEAETDIQHLKAVAARLERQLADLHQQLGLAPPT
ncbi:MAG TPA: DUF480 domain-containing protein [Urbifossiella sp.]|nr:DUF480 domain-containing protein [Urbifossiella sp.]